MQTAEVGDSGYTLNLILDTYRNVSCLFEEAEEDVREEIGYYIEEYLELGRREHYNEYGIDLEHPYEGLFLKTGRRYKYTINHTKKVYYLLDETDILFQNNTKNDFSDPLPILMGYGRVMEPGEWLGDIIGVADSKPEGYLLLKKLYMDKDMLRSYVKDSETNKEGIALAAILLLGADNRILSVPHYIRQKPFSECLMSILHMNIVI